MEPVRRVHGRHHVFLEEMRTAVAEAVAVGTGAVEVERTAVVAAGRVFEVEYIAAAVVVEPVFGVRRTAAVPVLELSAAFGVRRRRSWVFEELVSVLASVAGDAGSLEAFSAECTVVLLEQLKQDEISAAVHTTVGL